MASNAVNVVNERREWLHPKETLALGTLISFLIYKNKAFTQEFLAETGAVFRYKSKLFEKLWPQVSELTLLDQFRADSLLYYLESAVDKPGDLVECGVYRGGISILIASALRELGLKKKLYMFDSFAGLPKPNRQYDAYYGTGWLRAEEGPVRRLIEERGLSEYCVIRKGWFSDTLKQLPPSMPLCFVHVDCDLHDPAVECMSYLYPKLAPGAPMIFDDYYDGSGGVQSAVDRWARRTREIVHLGPAPQATIIKGMRSDQSGVSSFIVEGTEGPAISCDNLSGQTLYTRFVSQLSALYGNIASDLQRFASIVNSSAGPAPSLKSESFYSVYRAFFG